MNGNRPQHYRVHDFNNITVIIIRVFPALVSMYSAVTLSGPPPMLATRRVSQTATYVVSGNGKARGK